MGENLFLDAMEIDQFAAIQEIKLNKVFALKLISDLDKIFQTNFSIKDEENGVLIYMRRYASNSSRFRFIVQKSGISFRSESLGYYKCTQFKDLGVLYEKYKDSGTTAHSGFLSSSGHGNVNFIIPIYRNGDNLLDTLKDIIYLMEQEGFLKRF
jgi:hypothetical protein